MSFDSLSAEYRQNHCRTRKELFAAISLQNGDDIKTVSENLGHASVTFTLDVY
jgi:site-specific recombinase XerD